MLNFTGKSILSENEYIMADEAKNASLFTVGNGYTGVRGSFEEFGSTKIQGAFIRGYIDDIIEIVEPFCDNSYMRKYYFDETKLKHFDKQVSCINLPDFLLIRFKVGEKEFYPWEGTVLSWRRELNTKTATLKRVVKWKDEDENVTEFTFERFASYDNKHKFFIKATARPIGHDLPVYALSGVDKAVRTNGQIIIKEYTIENNNDFLTLDFKSGEKYGFKAEIMSKTRFYADGKECERTCGATEDLIYHDCKFPQAKVYTVEKEVCLYTERDVDITLERFKEYRNDVFDFQSEYKKHVAAYSKILNKFDVTVACKDKTEAAIRFANYHTIISANDMDYVHGISAKGLTGEKYNQFVWWDSEIYQMPVFIHAYPEQAKTLLMYRYRMLDDSRKNAEKEGRKGARYAFVSSVEGCEHVWIYARHPFLQIHINSDIAFGIINYFRNTGDEEFLCDYGAEMLYEIARYWLDRVTFVNGRYEILNVTGTDEHHPYVDNNAYTNYETAFVLKKIIEYTEKYGFKEVREKIDLTDEELERIKDVSDKMFLPLDENGLIPQFDGYFELSRTLEVEGNGTGTNFQMKKAGLYNKSQIIKQPDVMLLFSYLNIEVPGADYMSNWDYYEKMCESSSSLTFPVHAICSALAGKPLSYVDYLSETTNIDIWDIHKCAYQGVHSGCLAGAWYSVFRGVAGITVDEDKITIKPNPVPFWDKVAFSFVYHGKEINVKMTGSDMVLTSSGAEKVKVEYNGKSLNLKKRLVLSYNREV